MAVTLTTPQTLLGSFAPKSAAIGIATAALTVVAGTLFLTLCAKISVPVWPVPVTLQTFGVAALAAAFGWRIGVATIVAYIAEGLCGLPVFSGIAAGPAYLFGPTGGFILSWIIVAAIVGRAADMGLSRRLLPLAAVMLVADAIGFAIGFAWLVVVLAGLKSASPADVLGSAFDGAIRPFILWDVLKMAFAATSVAGAWSLFRKA